SRAGLRSRDSVRDRRIATWRAGIAVSLAPGASAQNTPAAVFRPRRTYSEAVCPCAPPAAGVACGAPIEGTRLERAGSGTRLLRSSAPHPRLSRLGRHYAASLQAAFIAAEQPHPDYCPVTFFYNTGLRRITIFGSLLRIQSYEKTSTHGFNPQLPAHSDRRPR